MATTEKIIIEIDVQSNTLKDTEDKIKKVSGALVKLRGDEKANENQLRATEAELRLLNKTYREQDRVLQASIKANNAAEGSLEQLKAQYVVAQAAVNKLSAEQRENTQEGKDQIAEVARLNAELKRIESSYGQNARNVGNYTEAVKPLRQQLRDLNMQMQQLAIQGKDNSDEFKNLALQAGKMREAMDDVNETVKRVANNKLEITFNGVIDAARGVAAGFGLVQGAAALMGSENEDLQKGMVKLQAIMLTINSLSEIQQLLRKEGAISIAFETLQTTRNTLAKTANAAATAVLNTSMGIAISIMNALGISTVATSGAFRLLTAVIAGVGIGAFVVAAGFLVKQIGDAVVEIYNIVTATEDYEKTQLALNRAIEASNKVYKENIDLLRSENDERQKLRDNNIDLLKSIGASEEKLRDIQSKNTKERLKDLDEERTRSTATFIQLSKLPLRFAMDLVKSNDEIRKYIKLNQLTLKQGELDVLNDIIQTNNKITDVKVGTQIDINNKILKAQEEFKKKTEDALSALNTLENKILSDNYEFRIKQLTDTYVKEGKIIEESYKLGLVNEQQYLTDKLALQNLYSQNLRAILSADAQFQKDLTNELIAGQDLIAQNQLDKQAENEAKSLEAYKIYKSEVKNVDDEVTKGIVDNNAQVLAIVLQQADLISKAFIDSIDENGLNLEKFSKQALAVVIDTIEKIVTAQALAAIGIVNIGSLATGQSIATGGVAGIIQGIALTALIKAAFTGFKAALLSQFEDGGIIPKAADGMLVGNRHAQGGIKIGTPSGMIEAEGGEVIINRKSVSMYKPLLSAINEAGGGVKFADGGQIYTPPVSQEFNILADMFKTMPQPVVSVVDIIDVTQKVGRVKATATL
jgi:hypothetical protein